jgi:hypothetical protein
METSAQTQTPQGHLPCYPERSERRNGKVARLPKAVRDQLNTMLLDGVSYPEIISSLGPAGDGLTEMNLSNWKNGGYVDWLRENQLTNAIQAKHELAQSIVERSGGDHKAGQAVLNVIALNLCEFLVETDPAAHRESLLSDADKFTRFVNAMVRLAEGGIKCQLHKFHEEDRAAEIARQKNPPEKRGISDEALRLAEQKLKLL